MFLPQGSLLTNSKLSSSVFGNDSLKLQPSHIRNAPWSILWPSPPFEFTSGVLLPDRRQDFKGFSSTSMFLRSPVTRFPSSPCDLRKRQSFRGAFLLTKSHVVVAAALACNYWTTIHQDARTHTQYSIYISIGCFCQEWNCKYLDSWKVIFTLTNYLKWPEFYSHHVIESFELHIK